MAVTDTSSGWHVRGHDGTAEWQRGPYAWAELVAFSRDGRLMPHNLVWHETRPDWQQASQIPGLFPATAPQPQPQPAPAPQPQTTPGPAPQQPAPAYVPPAGGPPATPPKKKRGLIVGIAIALIIAFVACGIGAWALFFRDGSDGLLGGGGGPTMGTADTTLPDSAALVSTEWGEVPANELLMVMVDGASRKDAEKAASSFGGTIVGEVEFIDLYQVRFTSGTAEQLIAAIAAAEADADVEYAYPITQVTLDAEIWGVRIDPYNDPVYGGGAGDGYNAVGVSKAWAFIKGAGVDLSDVKVGVTDDGLFRPGEGGESEFKGDVSIEFPDEQAGELAQAYVKDGKPTPYGSHGTAVSTIIGANPNNGGAAGIAGPLGNKLTIAMTNIFDGKYGDTTTTPDPDDVTKQDWSPGNTYSIGTLVAITNQIEKGAKVINCSWGNSNAHPKDVATYTRFFTKMAEKHPDVLFVMSGGNGGKEMDGAKRYPSGLKLDNMITVGALDNDGKQSTYTDWASEDYEVTLAAPGTQAVVGVDADGKPIRENGTSFAAPHVTAAAAMLKSLNPKLTAAQIKQILVETARPGVAAISTDPNAQSQLVPPEMGAGILAIDQAVLRVINDLRSAKGLPPFDEETLAKLGVVDAVAITGAAGEYQVKGIVEATGEKGANLKIEVVAENSAVDGATEQALTAAGEVVWDVTLPDDKGTIKVTRLDSGAASLITIEEFDISGQWSGTFTFTSMDVDPEMAEEQGCTAAILQGMIGTPMPMTMDLSVGEDGQGTGSMFIDIAAVVEDAESEPTDIGVSYSGSTVTFGVSDGGVMTAEVARSGNNLVMTGTLTYSGSGFSIVGAFSLSKPLPTQ
ncbi:MAG: S8 family serine peptidase [Coriobacteriia bacterium]|nr:S8 family serine peptidase [Coriobacteriia bacterium]